MNLCWENIKVPKIRQLYFFQVYNLSKFLTNIAYFDMFSPDETIKLHLIVYRRQKY